MGLPLFPIGLWVQSQSSLLDGLVAYYKLDDAAPLADAHAAHTLSTVGTVSSATGKINQARSFGSGRLQSSSPDFNFTGSFTISLWCKSSNWSSDYPSPIGKFQTTNHQSFFVYYDVAGEQFGFDISGDGTYDDYQYVVSPLATPTGLWSHLCLWYDHSLHTINLRVNGGTPASADFTGPAYATADPLTIGSSAGYNWRGEVDEVGLWNRVLTSDEQASLYAGGAARAYPFS